MSFALSDIALQLRNLYTHRGNDGDFTLTCQGRDIKAHSFILKMRSEQFQLFFHNLNKLHIFRCKYFETFLQPKSNLSLVGCNTLALCTFALRFLYIYP